MHQQPCVLNLYEYGIERLVFFFIEFVFFKQREGKWYTHLKKKSW